MIIGLIYLMFGLLYFAVWLTICMAKYKKWSERKKNCTQELSVRVVDILEKKTSRGGMIYKPVFMPADPANLLVIDSAYYSNLVSFEIGDTVELLINPENPSQFLYKDDSLNKGKTADIIGCCLPVFFFVIYLILSRR